MIYGTGHFPAIRGRTALIHRPQMRKDPEQQMFLQKTPIRFRRLPRQCLALITAHRFQQTTQKVKLKLSIDMLPL